MHSVNVLSLHRGYPFILWGSQRLLNPFASSMSVFRVFNEFFFMCRWVRLFSLKDALLIYRLLNT